VSNPPDQELVRRSLRGDRAAFGELMERHQRRVYNVCLRMLGRPEDAADATQDVFLTALRKLSGFRGASALSTWLHRIAVNTCYDALRRRSREVLVEEPLQEPAPSPDPSGAADARIDVQRALIQVPEDFRAVLVLHDVAGLPYEEVAEILGAPVGTVKSRLHRGRVALARVLRGEQPGPPRPSNLQENR
jgi:RNA polymerase sigma-70 factor (ECF subfamily)